MRSTILAGALAALVACGMAEVSAFGVAKLPALRAIGLRNSPQLGRQSKVAVRIMPGTDTSSSGSDPIISPFDPAVDVETEEGGSDGPLPLTLENVEKTLDEMRPYLMADGGNVRVSEIDGGVVKLVLEGNCGTCPSSTMTMKMGLERRLRERIPEIVDVVQDLGEGGPDLTPESIEAVLDTVRPFLNVAGGSIALADLRGVDGLQPTITLTMTGSSAALRSVKNEIMQRIQRNFMLPGLRIDWKD